MIYNLYTYYIHTLYMCVYVCTCVLCTCIYHVHVYILKHIFIVMIKSSYYVQRKKRSSLGKSPL